MLMNQVKLVEATFDYVYDFEGDKLVQKRK
jgi:hypothetical protein